MATSCSGFWADAPDVDPVYQRPGAQPDFGRFGRTPAPIWLWRFAQTLLDATGQPIADPALPIAVDACAAAGSPNRFGWEFMLDTVEWQPSVAVVNRGFSFGYAVTAANIAAIARGNVPDVTRVEQCSSDIRPAITISGGPMRTMGLYVRETVGATGLTPAAVKAVGDTFVAPLYRLRKLGRRDEPRLLRSRRGQRYERRQHCANLCGGNAVPAAAVDRLLRIRLGRPTRRRPTSWRRTT
jgi:hypothetical protein